MILLLCPLLKEDCKEEGCAWWECGSKSCFIGHGMIGCVTANALNNISCHISKLTEEVIKLGEGR